jgi:ATP-dependent DNA ligase
MEWARQRGPHAAEPERYLESSSAFCLARIASSTAYSASSIIARATSIAYSASSAAPYGVSLGLVRVVLRPLGIDVRVHLCDCALHERWKSRTRHGRECSADFPELASIAGVLGKRRVTLDGELVCLRGDGRPDFARLRRRLSGRARSPQPVVLQVFDVLHLDGRSTRALTYCERRVLLDELALDGPAWRTPTSVVVERAEDFVARVAELGLEGVVAKRLHSPYLPGRRSRAWVKHKLRRQEHLAVTGLRRSREGRAEALFVARRLPDGSFTGAGSIELGLHADVV